MEQLLSLDTAATRWINQHWNKWLDIIFLPVSYLGDAGLWPVLFLVGFLIFGDRRLRIISLLFGATLL